MNGYVVQQRNNMPERVENFFDRSAGFQAPQLSSGASGADQARAVAEVQAAMVVARMNPRDEKTALDRILNACTRVSLAERAVYSYPRGGQEITGPSIRLAEAIAQNWGNLQWGLREISQIGGQSTIQAFAWDMETNTRREVTFTVALKRDTKRGSYALTDSRDIYELVANQGARRMRACMLSLIPGDVIDAAVRQCQFTLQANVDMSKEGLQRTLDAFAEFGVTKTMIEKRFGRHFESLGAGQIVLLRNIYASLRDGFGVVADYFEPEEVKEQAKPEGQPQNANDVLKAKLNARIQPQMQPTPQVQPQPMQQTQQAEAQRVDLDAGNKPPFDVNDDLNDAQQPQKQIRAQVIVQGDKQRQRVTGITRATCAGIRAGIDKAVNSGTLNQNFAAYQQQVEQADVTPQEKEELKKYLQEASVKQGQAAGYGAMTGREGNLNG